MTNFKKINYVLTLVGLGIGFGLTINTVNAVGLTTDELACLENSYNCPNGADLRASLGVNAPKITWLNKKSSFVNGQSTKINFEIQGIGFQRVIVESGVSGNLPTAGPVTNNVTLASTLKYSGSIDAGTITELLEPGKITYFVRVTNEKGQLLAKDSFSADVKTKPTLPVTITVGNSKIYNLGTAITIKAVTKVTKAKVYIEVKQGTKVVSKSTLPNFSFVPKATGVYDILVKVNAVNYKPVTSQTKVTIKSAKLVVQPIASAWSAQKVLKLAPPKSVTKPVPTVKTPVKTPVKGLTSKELEKLR